MMTQASLPHMPAPSLPPAPPPPEASPPERRTRLKGQLCLTTPERSCLRDGPAPWRTGFRARIDGAPRRSPPQHGRLRRQWLAGWDAAHREIDSMASAWALEIRAALGGT